MSKINSYPKQEKLKSRKALDELFATGKSFTVFPIKVFYTLNPSDQTLYNKTGVNAGVGVSARIFKKAVERNRVKRLLREVYRTQKQELASTIELKKLHASVFFLFIGKELPELADLKKPMKKVLEKLIGIAALRD